MNSIHYQTEKNLRMSRLLSTREALAYIRKINGEGVKLAAFYRRIPSIPHVTEYQGHVPRHFFREEDLQHVHFRVKEKVPAPLPAFVRSDDDLIALRQRYGRLVTTDGALDIIELRTGRRYKPSALYKRMRSGTLVAVGKSGGKHSEYWFAADTIETMPLQP